MPKLKLDLAESIVILYLIERFFETLCLDDVTQQCLNDLIVFAADLGRRIGEQDTGRTRRLYYALQDEAGLGRVAVLGNVQVDAPLCRYLLFVAMHHLLSLEMAMANCDDIKLDYQMRIVAELVENLTPVQARIWLTTVTRIRFHND